MKTFVTIDDLYQVKHHFPGNDFTLETIGGCGAILKSDETVITILVSGMQDGSESWAVQMLMCDSPIQILHGHIKRNSNTPLSVQNAVNMALTKMTKGWLPQFLPAT